MSKELVDRKSTRAKYRDWAEVATTVEFDILRRNRLLQVSSSQVSTFLMVP